MGKNWKELVNEVKAADPVAATYSDKKVWRNITDPTDDYAKLKGVLNNHSSLRNDIVHRGIDLVRDDDIAILKYLNERIIFWIINNSKKIKTENHYAKYFQFIEMNNTEKKACPG